MMNTSLGASDTRAARRPDAPAEHDDPRNALIDAFEATITALLDNGFEVQLRARLARLLPLPPPEPDLFLLAPGDSRSASRPPGESPSAEDELRLVTLVGDCKRLEKLKMAADAHAAVTRIKTKALADLDVAKAARVFVADGDSASRSRPPSAEHRA